MKTWNWATKCLGLVAVMGMTSSVWAQAGAGGSAGGATGAGATGAVGAAPAAAAPASSGGTIWNFFGINKTCLKECKVKLCKSPIGMLLGNMVKPMSALSGGLIPPCCPKVLNDDALAKAAKDPEKAKGDAQAAAAKVAKDEAEAKERRAAVRYLGTVDCHYWGPEIEPALINALRKDKNECVRWEAAMALGNGCCCTRKTIEALTVSVYGVDQNGDTLAGDIKDPYDLNGPEETSERVKAAALAALQHCLSCYSTNVTPGAEKRVPGAEKKDQPIAQAPGTFQPAVLTKPAQPKTMAQVIEVARQMTMTPTTVGYSSVPESKHTISGVFSKALVPTGLPSDTPTQGAVMSTQGAGMSAPPSPRYSGLIPWLTR